MERSTSIVDRHGRHRSTMKVDRSIPNMKVDRSMSTMKVDRVVR